MCLRRLTFSACLFLLCLVASQVSAGEGEEGPRRMSNPYISKEVLVLLENDLANLASRIYPRGVVTYDTEEVTYPVLREISEGQHLSAKMGLMIIQQNNEIIRLLERLVEQVAEQGR